jgi:hypothetical protein
MAGKPKHKTGWMAIQGDKPFVLASVENLTGKRPDEIADVFKTVAGQYRPEQPGYHTGESVSGYSQAEHG